MAVLLALLSAVAYGTSDFVGGLVGRRTAVWSVAVVVQASSALSTATVALVLGGSPTSAALGWGALSGIGTGVGVGFLFRGMGSGRMSVVAPLSAVGAAVLPVVVGLLLGERPGLLVGVAMLLALPGIWLVSSGEGGTPGDRAGSSGVLDGLVAGAGFGVLFVALGQVPESAGLWPLALGQSVSTVTAVALAVALGATWRPRRAALPAVPAGPLGALAVICFQRASQSGLLTVSAVLASLYPAATILLAMVVLRERVHRTQAIGLALCGATVVLVSLG